MGLQGQCLGNLIFCSPLYYCKRCSINCMYINRTYYQIIYSLIQIYSECLCTRHCALDSGDTIVIGKAMVPASVALTVGEDRHLSQNYRYKCKMTTSDTCYATNPAKAKIQRASRLLHQVKSGWVGENIQAKGIAYVKTLCQERERLRIQKVIK